VWEGRAGDYSPLSRLPIRKPRKPLAAPLDRGISPTAALKLVFFNAYFDSLGLPDLTAHGLFNPSNRRMRIRMSGSVGGEDGQPSPHIPMCMQNSPRSPGLKADHAFNELGGDNSMPICVGRDFWNH
jgi:hypothetical protein